jgi:hypothetical protein
MIRSGGTPGLLLAPHEEVILRAVIMKFAVDLVLFRLASARPTIEAAALEELATASAIMLDEQREPSGVESLAVQAILESVSAGAPREFFEELCSESPIQVTPDRMRRLVRLLHSKLVGTGFRAVA